MAAYQDIYGLFSNDIRLKVEVALLIRAQAYLDAANPTAQQRAWARHVFTSTTGEAMLMLKYLLAKNNGLTTAQIAGASDATIQSQVDAVAAQFVAAFSEA